MSDDTKPEEKTKAKPLTQHRKPDDIKQIAAALSKFQGEMEAAKKDKTNPHYKSSYADLRSIWDVIREPLAKNGLAVVQCPRLLEDNFVLITTVYHTSGQSLRSEYPINPVQNNPQGIGSALTYARRYGLSSMLGVVSEDDDGNAASGKGAPADKKAPPKAKPKASPGCINRDQQVRLFAIAGEAGKEKSEIKEYLEETWGLKSSGEIKTKDYEKICEWVKDKKTNMPEFGPDGGGEGEESPPEE